MLNRPRNWETSIPSLSLCLLSLPQNIFSVNYLKNFLVINVVVVVAVRQLKLKLIRNQPHFA